MKYNIDLTIFSFYNRILQVHYQKFVFHDTTLSTKLAVNDRVASQKIKWKGLLSSESKVTPWKEKVTEGEAIFKEIK